MLDKNKRELIKMVENYGALKFELGKKKDLELEKKKDNLLSEIIDFIKKN